MEVTCPRQVVRVGLMGFGERHDTRTNGQHYTLQQTTGDQSGGKLNVEIARHVRHPRSILDHMSCMSTRMPRGCYDEAAPM